MSKNPAIEARCQTLLCHGDVSLESLLGRLGGLCGAGNGGMAAKNGGFKQQNAGIHREKSGFAWFCLGKKGVPPKSVGE